MQTSEGSLIGILHFVFKKELVINLKLAEVKSIEIIIFQY